MPCAWIAACIFIGFSLQVNLVLVGGLSLSDCEDYQFKLNNDNQCRDCPACPAGQEYTVHCGYEERNGNITKPKKSCEDCIQNYYKSSASPNMCDSCTATKCPEGAKMIHPCNKTHDLKCKCKKGFYTAPDGSCVRCSPCCGNPSVYGRKFSEKECEDAGMNTCSCRPLQGCTKSPDCKKSFLEFSTKNPSKKTSPSPTITSTTKESHKNNTTIKPKRPTQKITNPELKIQKNERKEEKEQNFVTGWLIATVIGIVLILAILFYMLKHLNILKKIKVFLKPRQQVVENDTSHSVITVEERFEAPAQPVITNYAQRMLPEEEVESQSHHIQQHHALFNHSTVSASDLGYDEFADYDPWVYRDSIEPSAVQMRPRRWPLTRAEVARNPGYGEYIEILRSEDVGDDCLSTQGNNSGSLQQLDEVITNEPPPQTEDKQEIMKVNMDNKPGQEHSDSEEPPTSIPATASGENTFIIATGQHRGMITGEFVRNEFSKGKQDKVSSDGKRRKKQPEKKRKTRRPPDDNSMESSEDILRCTCGDCSYRPYVREEQLCHCTDCVPQATDDLYNIIERRCLRAEICKELNKKGVSNWRELCTYIRIDKDITSIDQEENPAEVVLEKLKSSRPRLKLKDFSLILNRIKRHDIMEMIMHHHIKCMLCRRNSFDGSLVNIHTISEDPSTTWMTSKLSS